MGVVREMKRLCKQDVVYWKRTGVDRSGQVRFKTGQPIKTRWEDVTEQFLDSKGGLQMSKAKVYLYIPQTTAGGESLFQVFIDETVGELDVIWKGAFGDLTDRDKPFANPQAYEIRRVDRDPDENGVEELITLYL